MTAALAQALARARAAEYAGRIGEAYEALLAAPDLALRPNAGTTALLGFLHRYAPRQRHAEVDAVWCRALHEVWARPADLALPIAGYLARDTSIAAALQGTVPADLPQQLENDALFHALLRSTVIPDPQWERLLQALVQAAISAGLHTPTPQLTETLALWAWLSERVALPATEPAGAGLHAPWMAAAHSGQASSAVAIALVALVTALDPEAWAVHRAQWPDSDMVRRLLNEPLQEAALASAWPAPAARDAAVAAHYEAAPYPRWQREPLGLAVMLPPAVARKIASLRQPAVLIAGCGTGQQLFVAHDTYPGARLTALDLSRRSLAYAQRQCEAAGLPVSAWHCADLVDFDAGGARFAVVECIGVLHHLLDPAAGWRALAARTQGGGLLHVAVYSRRARAPVTALRERLLAGGRVPSQVDVRALRSALLSGAYGPLPPAIAHSVDFYSWSGCRDLLLNARERVYDLPEMVAEARAAGFDWLALQAPPAVAEAASRQFGRPAEQLTVAQWHAFEAVQPQSFGGMFEAWFLRRPGA